MRIGACEGCDVKDQMILDLRKLLDDTTRSLLAITDARAYAMRYPAERPPVREANVAPAPPTLAQLRARPYKPAMSPAAIEAAFDANHALEQKLGDRA